MSELLELAHQVVRQALDAGADEVTALISRGTHVSITRRDGRVEQATEASHRGLVVSMMVDDRYSSHSSSDLRPEAIGPFLDRAVAATRFIEADPERRQPDLALCGRGTTQEELDQDDPSWYDRTADERARDAAQFEAAIDANRDERAISQSVFVADGQSEVARVMSNGFAGLNRGAWFSAGAETTLREDGGKRPEAAAYYAARHLSDLPSPTEVAEETLRRALARLGARPAPSGLYPMLLANRTGGRFLGMLLGPLSGSSLYEKRSCLIDRLGTRIASDKLTILDDPTIPRGLASRPWDGDALLARPRTIVRDGVLQSYYINVHYGRKLGMEPTSGSRSNWIVPPGTRDVATIAAELPRALRVTSFLGGNSNSTTGNFSFGVRGQLLEHGEVVQPIAEMNVSGNLLDVLDRLIEVADDPWMWSSARTPTLLFDGISFSGS